VGLDQVREFYSQSLHSQIPPDTEFILVSRTIGTDQLVDEMVLILRAHNSDGLDARCRADKTGSASGWIIGFRDGKIAHEHLYRIGLCTVTVN